MASEVVAASVDTTLMVHSMTSNTHNFVHYLFWHMYVHEESRIVQIVGIGTSSLVRYTYERYVVEACLE